MIRVTNEYSTTLYNILCLGTVYESLKYLNCSHSKILLSVEYEHKTGCCELVLHIAGFFRNFKTVVVVPDLDKVIPAKHKWQRKLAAGGLYQF